LQLAEARPGADRHGDNLLRSGKRAWVALLPRCEGPLRRRELCLNEPSPTMRTALERCRNRVRYCQRLFDDYARTADLSTEPAQQHTALANSVM
jgi:hypothetical protein